jgi:hypothetical protein
MKKIIIISTLICFGFSVHAQRAAKDRTRHATEKQKSESAVRRTAEKKDHVRSNQAHKTRQANAGDFSRSKRTVPSGRHTYDGRWDKGQKPGQNRVNPRTSNAYKSQRRDADKGRSTEKTHAYRSAVKKGTVSSSTGQRNNQSVRAGSGGRIQAARTQTEPRRHYTTPNRHAVRTNHVNGYRYHYNPVRYQQVHYHYRTPKRLHVTWTNRMYREYRIMYPEFRYWYYPIGYQIVTVPFYNAYYHIGEVRNVYGRVHEVYYSWTTDEYHLYFGGNYPYHDFTVIIPGRQARRYDSHPELFFEGRYILVTGLLSTFEGRPELIVKRRHQIHLY